MNAILSWLLGALLNWLAGRIAVTVEEHAADMAEQERLGRINEATLKAYQEAKDRADRIKAATDLLNGTPP